MKPLVTWWHDAGTGARPERPLLVVATDDDPDAVSILPQDYGATWDAAGTATGRVAAHLGVPVVRLGETLPKHDLLLLGEVGRGLTGMGARLAVGMYGAEPQMVVGHGSGITDLQWMAKVAYVRDSPVTEPSATLAALAGLIEHSEVPVLLDGVLCAAAAAVAAGAATAQAPVLGSEPAQRYLLDRADVPLWGVSGLGPGEGLGALVGLASLQLALLAAG